LLGKTNKARCHLQQQRRQQQHAAASATATALNIQSSL
jgi:hypothetical protein